MLRRAAHGSSSQSGDPTLSRKINYWNKYPEAFLCILMHVAVWIVLFQLKILYLNIVT